MPPYAPSYKKLGKRKQVEEDALPVSELNDALSLEQRDSDDEQEIDSAGETEDFPEIFAGGSETEPDSEEEDSETERQRERLEEELLEQELAEEDDDEDEDESDESDSVNSEDPDALDKWIEKKSSKPYEANEDDVLAPGTSLDELERNSILGYDARNFNAKRRQVVSEITGQDKFEWDEIEPGYGSESGGEDEVRLVHLVLCV